MLIAVTALSHDGLLRDHNEDSLVIGPWTTSATTTLTPQTLLFHPGDPVVVAVADGLGGHPSGDVASSVVVQSLARVGATLADEQSVHDALHACNQAVYDQAGLEPARAGMGTTVAGVVVEEHAVLVFNVGDSRVYAVEATGQLTHVSVDDSPPLGPGETHSVIVTQTLGGGDLPTPVDPHVSSRPIDTGTRYLACTDGLSDVVADAEIQAVLADHVGPEAVVELWRAAMNAGGPDNITLALVEPVSDDSSSP